MCTMNRCWKQCRPGQGEDLSGCAPCYGYRLFRQLVLALILALRPVLGLVLFLALALPQQAQAEPSAPASKGRPTVLEIGVLPYVGLNELIRAYGPLASYLEQQLGRPVRIVTARDYPEFVAHTARGDYPLVITASHFARLAQQDHGFIPLLRPLTTFHVLLLVRQDSDIQSVAELLQRRVATPGTLAQTATMARLALKANGLNVGRNLYFVDAGNHKNAMLAVSKGEADACFVSEGAYRHTRDEDKRLLREIRLPHPLALRDAIPVIYAASPAMPSGERVWLSQLISHFANQTEPGKAWINSLKYEGLRPPTAAEMQGMDAEVKELRQLLNSTGLEHGK